MILDYYLEQRDLIKCIKPVKYKKDVTSAINTIAKIPITTGTSVGAVVVGTQSMYMALGGLVFCTLVHV